MLIMQCYSVARWILPFFAGLTWAVSGYASPQLETPKYLTEIYQQAIASPTRIDADRLADAKRKPLEFLQFTDVRPGMLVLDIAAGGGYTTQLLSLAVGSTGIVWAQSDKPMPALEARLANQKQSNIIPVIRPLEDPVPDDAPKLDLITIIMNYHDISYMAADRVKMNQRLFAALKPGGHLVVMDHSAKAGAGTSAALTLHRIEEKIVLAEMQQAGFMLIEESNFLRNPGDPRDQAFFKMNIPTDIFALRFYKP